MKYTIREVLPAQIIVDYENGSWAIVPIPPDATHDQIDDAVSKYDPGFLPKPETLINPNISVGEQRESKPIQIKEQNNNQITEFVPNQVPFSSTLSPIDIIQISEKLAQQGDTRIKDILESKINDIISNPEFSVDNIISSISYNTDDIMAQAEAELNAEQSGKQTGN